LRPLWEAGQLSEDTPPEVSDEQRAVIVRLHQHLFQKLNQDQQDDIDVLSRVIADNAASVDDIAGWYENVDADEQKILIRMVLPMLRRYADLTGVTLPWSTIEANTKMAVTQEGKEDAGKGKNRKGKAPTPTAQVSGTLSGSAVVVNTFKVIVMGFWPFGKFTPPPDAGVPGVLRCIHIIKGACGFGQCYGCCAYVCRALPTDVHLPLSGLACLAPSKKPLPNAPPWRLTQCQNSRYWKSQSQGPNPNPKSQ
jgi:hypothetical protein